MRVGGTKRLSIYIQSPVRSVYGSFRAGNDFKTGNLYGDQASQHTAYKMELNYALRQYRQMYDHLTVRSLYFGGTPCLSPFVVLIMDQLRSEGIVLEDNTEVTVEADPTTLTDVSALSTIGVTRFSLGVHSLTNDKLLKFFGLGHNGSQARESLGRLARDSSHLRHGFSFDLMFGYPSFSGKAWSFQVVANDLRAALPYASVGGHVSICEMSLEAHTKMARQISKGTVKMPSQDQKADEYEQIVNALRADGFEQYEISCFSRFGKICLHNYSFWMGEDLIGIGPGAHGRVTTPEGVIVRTHGLPDADRWLAQVKKCGHGQISNELAAGDYQRELIMLGLRTEQGLSYARFNRLTRDDLDNWLDQDNCKYLMNAQMLSSYRMGQRSLPTEYTEDYHGTRILRATGRGRAVLDAVLPMLLRN